MSVAVPAPASERGPRDVWDGTDVTADAIAAQLVRLNREHAHRAHGHGATRTLNLVVAPGEDVPEGAIRARLRQLRASHPSRTIVVREHAAARLDAHVEIDCAVGAGGTGLTAFCHDAVLLHADAARLGHADSLVHPLRVVGLPVVLWLAGAGGSPAEQPLARAADAIVLDSGLPPSPRDAFSRAARLGAAAPVRDLAWMRLARWRQRVANAFAAPQRLALLDRAERLEIRFAGADTAAPLLLAGWIAARAGWTVTRVHGAGETWAGGAQRADGGSVALTLGSNAPGGGEPPGVHALTFDAGEDERLELVEPVEEPGEVTAFAAALRAFDEPAPGYEPALAAIGQGLAAA